MIFAGVHDDEIDDVTEAHAIRQISEDAREQQRARAEHAIVVSWRAHEIVERPRSKRPRRVRRRTSDQTIHLLKLAESNAGIFRISKLKKSTDHNVILAEAQRLHGPRF